MEVGSIGYRVGYRKGHASVFGSTWHHRWCSTAAAFVTTRKEVD